MRKTVIVTALLAVVLHGVAIAQTPGTPPVPGNLVAQSPAELQPRVLLSWNSSVGPWFFRIYRSMSDTLNFRWIGIAQTNKFEDANVIAGVQYYYAVTAAQFVDSALRESRRSNVAGVRAYARPAGPKGTLRGMVVDQGSLLPIPKVRIRFFKLNVSADRIVETATDAGGWYTAQLDTGQYLVRAEELAPTVTNTSHVPEWYDNAATIDAATPVAVHAADTATASFALAPGTQPPYAYISGVVTDDQGAPLSGAAVAFVRPIQEMNAYAVLSATTPGTGPEAKVIPGIGYSRGVVWVGYTNVSGKFFAQVVAGRPYVAMAARDGYVPVLYDNTTDPTQAAILTIRGDTTGINFRLAPKSGETGSMMGTVEDEDGSEVPARIILFPRPKGGDSRPAVFVFTDSTGTFEYNDLPAGTYSVLAIPYSDCSAAYYKEGTTSVVSWLEADTVVVDGVPATVTIRLPRVRGDGLTRISGRILSVDQHGIPGVRVVARTSDGKIAGYGLSDHTGAYTVEAVSNGAVTLFVDRFQFNLVQAPITVPQNTYAMTNVDFVLTSSYTTAVQYDGTLPGETQLYQNYPNPFNPSTTIRYDVAEQAAIQLRVFDILGREVAVLADGVHPAGRYTVVLDGSRFASGMYYCALTVNGARSRTRTMRIVLVK